jgi:GrpB-like predicted nucleotidyltransferase (UPF0157 family)
MPERIRIVPYRPAWRSQFYAEQHRLLVAMAGAELRIEHIGSTAVKGLAAKPIVDMLLGVADAEQLEDSIALLRQVGYQYHHDHERIVPERRFFTQDRGSFGQFNVHVALLDSNFFWDRLNFRNRLRQCTCVTAAYCQLKCRLACCFRDDPQGYSNAKTSFVASVLAMP